AAATAAPAAVTTVPPLPTQSLTGFQPAGQQGLRAASSILVAAGVFPAGFASSRRLMVSNPFVPPFLPDNKHNLHPGLCVGYSTNADSTVWTLKVDPNAKWSDGSKLTAQDIKAGWEANSAPVPAGAKLNKFSVFVNLPMSMIDGQADQAAG